AYENNRGSIQSQTTGIIRDCPNSINPEILELKEDEIKFINRVNSRSSQISDRLKESVGGIRL
ncbi:hypothetical protein WA026_004478, partial [Henosepilachna vigintioctopunctata]